MKFYPDKAVYYTCNSPWFDKSFLVLAITQIQFVDMELNVFLNAVIYLLLKPTTFGFLYVETTQVW